MEGLIKTAAKKVEQNAIARCDAKHSGYCGLPGWWLLTRRCEEGQPLLALHPVNNDIYRGSNILG